MYTCSCPFVSDVFAILLVCSETILVPLLLSDLLSVPFLRAGIHRGNESSEKPSLIRQAGNWWTLSGIGAVSVLPAVLVRQKWLVNWTLKRVCISKQIWNSNKNTKASLCSTYRQEYRSIYNKCIWGKTRLVNVKRMPKMYSCRIHLFKQGYMT